jgi:hypothetical protein
MFSEYNVQNGLGERSTTAEARRSPAKQPKSPATGSSAPQWPFLPLDSAAVAGAGVRAFKTSTS